MTIIFNEWNSYLDHIKIKFGQALGIPLFNMGNSAVPEMSPLPHPEKIFCDTVFKFLLAGMFMETRKKNKRGNPVISVPKQFSLQIC